MITTQILTKNNENTIERALQSLKPLDTKIVVADLGSTDNTIDICKRLGAKVFAFKLDYDYSSIRNLLVEHSKTEWQFMLHPWEALDDNVKPIIESSENSKLLILKDDLLLKELRLWKKNTAHFERPVYENLEPSTGKIINVMIYSDISNELGKTQEILNHWKNKAPLSPEPDYYQACTYLTHRQYDDFIRLADHYLFLKNTSDESVLMIRYYLAIVYCYVKKNPIQAINNIMECIAIQPLMAEFWCILGDIYFHLKEFSRAKGFYENAIILGSQRKPDDSMPIELSKYDEYPNKMIQAIEFTKQHQVH